MPKIIRPKTLAGIPTLEREVQAEVRAWLADQYDVTIFRNAQAYVTFPDGHKAKVGLGTGSADLIGSLTYEFSGIPFARALGIEVKRKGQKLRPEQALWHDAMHKRGWIVGVAWCLQDAIDIINKARELRR